MTTWQNNCYSMAIITSPSANLEMISPIKIISLFLSTGKKHRPDLIKNIWLKRPVSETIAWRGKLTKLNKIQVIFSYHHYEQRKTEVQCMDDSISSFLFGRKLHGVPKSLNSMPCKSIWVYYLCKRYLSQNMIGLGFLDHEQKGLTGSDYLHQRIDVYNTTEHDKKEI